MAWEAQLPRDPAEEPWAALLSPAQRRELHDLYAALLAAQAQLRPGLRCVSAHHCVPAADTDGAASAGTQWLSLIHI